MEYMTTVEVAAFLNVNKATVIRWQNLGKIPYERLNKPLSRGNPMYRYRRSDIENLLTWERIEKTEEKVTDK